MFGSLFGQNWDSIPASFEETEKTNKWQIYQDSLRANLLSTKPNSIFKSSILEELYLWNYLKEEDGKVKFNLDFDLHAFDCMAPDCYNTNLVFSFSVGDSLIFPSALPYKIRESGCVSEKLGKGIFILKESTENWVNYYSIENKICLIFQGRSQDSDHVYLFMDVEKGFANSKKLIDSKLNSELNNKAPYRISRLCRGDYESIQLYTK